MGGFGSEGKDEGERAGTRGEPEEREGGEDQGRQGGVVAELVSKTH